MLVRLPKLTELGEVAIGHIVICTDRGHRILGLFRLATCLRGLVQRVKGHSTPSLADEAGIVTVNFGIIRAYYMFP